jgi:hypothetical protein
MSIITEFNIQLAVDDRNIKRKWPFFIFNSFRIEHFNKFFHFYYII